MACKFAQSRPPRASPKSLDHGHKVNFQTRSITASKCISNSDRSPLEVRTIKVSRSISKLTRSVPPSASPNLHNYFLQARMITVSKCIAKPPPSQPPSVNPSSLDYVHQNCLITALECISKLTRPRCGETVELQGRQPVINSLPHLAWYP